MDRPVVYRARLVRTLDPGRPLAEAVAVHGRKVLAVGSLREALDAAGSDAQVVDVPGYVVPGLVDSHGHLASLGRSLTTLSFLGTQSPGEVLERASAGWKQSRQGDWIIGRGWDQNDWGQPEFPDRRALDSAFPNQPVNFRRVDGHASWVNAEALRRAGITRATPDPPGGRILRDRDGEATGVLIDNAMDLVDLRMPPPSDEQLQRQLTAAIMHCAKLGLTGVHDAGMDLRTFKLLQTFDAVGALTLRVYALADGQGPDALQFLERGKFSGRHLVMRAAKLLADGALGSRGAALHEPYSDEPGSRGLLLLSPAELAGKAHDFATAGFQVAIHAIGDRGNTVALDALEQLPSGGRHRVEHVQVLSADDVARFARAGIVASMQPTHATSDMPWAEARLGEERARLAYAWKTVRSSGAQLALGSDFPVEDASPLLGLYAARTRQDLVGKPEGGWHPTERLTGEEALVGYTLGAAYASFSEDVRGSLAPGKDADLVALSVDPVEGSPATLLSAKVLLTVVDGVELYRTFP